MGKLQSSWVLDTTWETLHHEKTMAGKLRPAGRITQSGSGAENSLRIVFLRREVIDFLRRLFIQAESVDSDFEGGGKLANCPIGL